MSGQYGAVSDAVSGRDTVSRRGRSVSILLVGACAISVALASGFFLSSQVLSHHIPSRACDRSEYPCWQDENKIRPSELEEEISSYGTGASAKERSDTDNVYENTWNEDPGHISRAELRFNKALQSAGGLGMAHVGGGDSVQQPARKVSGKQNLKQWTAYPDNTDDSGTVNIIINSKKHAKTVSSRFGMSTLAARKDLESYFDGLDTQIHSQERKHVSEVLQRLSSGNDAISSDSGTSKASMDTDSSDTRVSRKQSRHKDTSMLRLLQKAMRSQEFAQEVKDLKAELHVGWHT